LLKKVGFKGKHKLANKWERDPYMIESQPDTAVPVYVLTPEHGRSRKVTVHRNMLPNGVFSNHIEFCDVYLPFQLPLRLFCKQISISFQGNLHMLCDLSLVNQM
jgi:hypothetical protein